MFQQFGFRDATIRVGLADGWARIAAREKFAKQMPRPWRQASRFGGRATRKKAAHV